MTLGELLAAIPPATYVFIAIDRQHPGRAEGTIYGPREDLKIPQDLEAASVTCLYLPKDRLKIATGLIERAAFMAASLKELEAAINEKGYTDEYQNGESQRGTKKASEVEIYNTMVKNYTAAIKALVDMAPEDSGLDPEAAAILNHIAKRK